MLAIHIVIIIAAVEDENLLPARLHNDGLDMLSNLGTFTQSVQHFLMPRSDLCLEWVRDKHKLFWDIPLQSRSGQLKTIYNEFLNFIPKDQKGKRGHSGTYQVLGP